MEKLGEHALDGINVRTNVRIRQQRSLSVFAARVADLSCAAAHQRDGPVASLLQPVQHHDLNQTAHVQRACRSIEANVTRDDFARGEPIELGQVGALMDEAALVEYA